MERSEPALVPEWLKSSGSVAGGGSANHHFPSPNLHSDDHFVSKHARNKSPLSRDYDIGRTFASDRTTSSYFRRSTSSNSASHLQSYSSFGRSHHDRDWEKNIHNHRDMDKSVLGARCHYEHSDPLGSILPSKFEKEQLRRSQSMVSGKQGDMWLRKVAGDLTNSSSSLYSNGNGLFTRCSVVRNVDKTAFERDFPSLGVEERQSGSEIGRVKSPGLSTAIQTLQSGNAAVTEGDRWTSALAEVPVIVGNNSTTSSQQNVSVNSASVAPVPTTGLNMAETLVQGPRTQTLSQLSVGTQRLEELAIKQSRQLIPMTPSMPKTLVVSPSENSKAKIVQQQQHTLHTVNHSRGEPVRSDIAKTFNEGRLRVLKPSRELNGVSSTTKDSLSPTNVSKVVNSPHGTSLASGFPFRSSSSSPKRGAERSSGPFRVAIEKRPMSQAQSRNDFFNLLKKKSSTNSFPAVPDSCPASSVMEKSHEIITEDARALVILPVEDSPLSDSSIVEFSIDNSGGITHNGNTYDGSWVCLGNGEKHSSPDMILDPDEEEAAFLRSLGWEENAGEDEGLTEEEISAFVKEYMKLRPSSKLLNGMWSTMLFNPQDGCCGGASSGLNSSK